MKNRIAALLMSIAISLGVMVAVAPASQASGAFYCTFHANNPRPGYPVLTSTRILCAGAPIPAIRVRTTLYKDNRPVATTVKTHRAQNNGHWSDNSMALVKYYNTAGVHKYQTRTQVWVVGAAALINQGTDWSSTITYG